MHRPGVEPATYWSRVQRPSHYATEPPGNWATLHFPEYLERNYQRWIQYFAAHQCQCVLNVCITVRLQIYCTFYPHLCNKRRAVVAQIARSRCKVLSYSTFIILGLIKGKRLYIASKSLESCISPFLQHLRNQWPWISFKVIHYGGNQKPVCDLYTVSGKYFRHNFIKYWPIYTILPASQSAENLQ